MKMRINFPVAAMVLLSYFAVLGQNASFSSSDVGHVDPPPQSVNAGFTKLLVNQDFSRAVLDLGCAGASQKHFWNQGLWWEKSFPPCNQIWIKKDPSTGQNVLDLRWLPSQTDTYDATTVETVAGDYSQYYGFQHGYYEAILRVVPWKIGGMWPEFWMWGANSTIYANLPPWGSAPADEIDVVEPHGEIPTWITSAIHGWGTGNAAFIYHTPVPSLDYSQNHKFGLLWTTNGRLKAGSACFYLDDVKKGCATTDAAAEYQRHFLILSMGVGCQFKYGNRSCINVPVTNVSHDGFGTIRLTVKATAGFRTGDTATIAGVRGVPGANGVFVLSTVDYTHLDLKGSKFSGTYVGGGIVNPLTHADMYVKSVRVWTCAADAISGC